MMLIVASHLESMRQLGHYYKNAFQTQKGGF